MTEPSAPPVLATRFLARLLPANVREPFLGDLEEGFHDVLASRGPRAARRWYWGEALRGAFARPPRSAFVPNASRGNGPVTTAFADVRFALRLVRRHHGFTALVVFILAVGIGATTAIFSAVYPILLAPLPYPHADRLVTFEERGKDGSRAGIGFATVKDVADMNRSFATVAAMTSWQAALTGRATPQLLEGEHVSSTFFATLGVHPALGRDFTADEDRPGAPRVLILTDALWRGRFGGDSAIVGTPVTLDGIAFTVIGVMPAGFANVLAPNAQIWTPLRYDVSLPYACRTCHHVSAIARLKPGVSVAAAAADLNAISARLVAEHPTEYEAVGMVVPRLQDQVTNGVRPALLAVLGAVTLLLLISCANVANLLLARAAGRRAEFAVRAALGAGRGRVIRQLLAESVVLTGAGGVLGIAVAMAGVRGLIAIAPPGLPRTDAIGVSGPVLGFAVVVVTVVAMICGVIPAWHAMRADLYAGVKQSGRRSIGNGQAMRAALVVSEVALASMLLVGSGLLVRSMVRLFAVSPGFDETNRLTMQIQTTGRAFDDSAYTLRYFDRVLAGVGALPGVRSAALTSQLPLSGDYDSYGVHVESKPRANPDQDPNAFRYAVTAGYFETMRIPLRRGRLLTPRDRGDQPAVAVINESFARKVWPNEDPIGQRVRLGAADKGAWRTIVGIVGDVKHVELVRPPVGRGVCARSAVAVCGRCDVSRRPDPGRCRGTDGSRSLRDLGGGQGSTHRARGDARVAGVADRSPTTLHPAPVHRIRGGGAGACGGGRVRRALRHGHRPPRRDRRPRRPGRIAARHPHDDREPRAGPLSVRHRARPRRRVGVVETHGEPALRRRPRRWRDVRNGRHSAGARRRRGELVARMARGGGGSGVGPAHGVARAAFRRGILQPVNDPFASARLQDSWNGGPAAASGADELDQLVYLSNLVGREPRLVQPGGGNTSIKIGDALLVKGSGTDLRTIGRQGFTRLSLPALGALRTARSMLDDEMMRFMAGCMLEPGPTPSVETPLHSLLPHRVIAHTHDVATMS